MYGMVCNTENGLRSFTANEQKNFGRTDMSRMTNQREQIYPAMPGIRSDCLRAAQRRANRTRVQTAVFYSETEQRYWARDISDVPPPEDTIIVYHVHPDGSFQSKGTLAVRQP